MKNRILIILLSAASQAALAQKVGINNTAPFAALDINGDVALRSTDLTISTTYTYALDVNTVKQSSYKLKATPLLGNFILAGIAAGTDGRVITLTNRSGFSLEIYDEDVTTLAGNRIQTGTSAPLAVYPNGSITLQYEVPENVWLIKSVHNNSLNYFGGAGGTSYWDIAGTNISNTNTGNVGIGTTPLHSRLEINGRVGATVAMFGADAFGVGISANNPEIGFNYFFNGGTKTMKAGYAANLGMEPGTGNVYLGNFSGNQSTADFGDITGYQYVLTVQQNGNVGVGTTTPGVKLDVQGQGRFRGSTLSSPGNFGYLTSGGNFFLNNSADGYGLSMDAGKIQAERPRPLPQSGSLASTLLLNPFGGNVGIGTSDPGTYKLAVNGSIRAKEIRINTGWADYVFADTYYLKPLPEVASFIKKNKHLPGILPAAVIEKDGADIGHTQTKLLEKIEELTLYMIEANKLIMTLQQRVTTLENNK